MWRAPERPEVLAAVPVGEMKLARQEWILGGTETKLALLAKKVDCGVVRAGRVLYRLGADGAAQGQL